MKAIRIGRFGPPEVMAIEEVRIPAPGPGEVLVEIKAAGVNPVETYMRAGLYYSRELPFTPGSDAAGIIEAAGEGVQFRPGERVYTSGALTGSYAEKALCNATQVHRLPDNVTFQQGACIGVPYATAFRAIFQKARALPGETVLIHGATGGVGTAALQFAKAYGLKAIGTAGSQKGRDLALKEGARYVLDHTDERHFDKLMEVTSGRGADIIIELLANANLSRDLKVLARFGRVVVVGCRGSIEIDPRDTMGRDATITGMSLFNAPEEEIRSAHAAIRAGLENGTLRPAVGREMPLSEAARAHHMIMEERAFGKIVLIP